MHIRSITSIEMIAFLITYASITAYIASLINNIDPPEGSFDETCHFPIATLYCNGSYDKWNHKVTTPPGLYIFTVAPIKLLNLPCTIYNLRYCNVAFNAISFILLHSVIAHYQPTMTRAKRIAMTVNLAIFPLNYFFSFLYYTDPLSTLLHLLMHFLWIKKSYKLSAVAGFFAVLTRQTAIVWIFFHGILTLVKTINEKSKGSLSLMDLVKRSIYRRAEILQNSFGYTLIGVMFAVFVYLNDGIVLGDRSNHQVTRNMPQFLYFSLFTGFCCLPHLISQKSQMTSFIKDHKALTASIFVVYAVIVRFNTVAHWYNLTDPHHLTTYFTTAVYNSSYFALSLVPLYTISTIFIIYNSFRALDKWTASVFLFVIAMTLIFQLLLEMRYFIVAFVLFRLLIPTRRWSVLVSEFCLFFVVNVVTISLYILRPRLFPDDPKDFQLVIY